MVSDIHSRSVPRVGNPLGWFADSPKSLPAGAWPSAITRGLSPKALLMIQAVCVSSRSIGGASGTIKNFGHTPRLLVDCRIQRWWVYVRLKIR
jgi:hypothetical protein